MVDSSKGSDGKPKAGDFEKLKICMANAIIDHNPQGNDVSSGILDNSQLGLKGRTENFNVGSVGPSREIGSVGYEITGVVESSASQARFAVEEVVRGAKHASVFIQGEIGNGTKVDKTISRGTASETEQLKEEVTAIGRQFQSCVNSSDTPVLKRPINGFGLKP